MNNGFHVHSMYSFNDSTQTPDEIVKRIKEIGGKSVTLTDHGSLLGIDAFMDAGKKYGINTVPGIEAYTENRRHLIIVAKDYEGFQSIGYALRDANEHIEKVRKLPFPIMNNEIIEKYFKNNTHVMASSACIKGVIADIFLENIKTKKKISKEKSKVTECKEGYEKYIKLTEYIDKINDRIAKYKESQKKARSYTNKAYLNKIISRKKKYGQTASAELKDEIEKMESKRKEAEAFIEKTEKCINELKDAKEKYTKNRKDFSKDRNKYLKAIEKTEKVEYKDEKKLYNEALTVLKWYKSIFTDFYIELQYHGLEEESYVMPILLKLAKETNTPIIAANDAHMTLKTPECSEARRIVRFNYFKTAVTLTAADLELYIKTDEEIIESLSKIIPKEDVLRAIKATEVLDTFNVVFPQKEHYPSIKVEGRTSNEVFDELLDNAKQKKIREGLWNNVYEERLEHEKKIIKQMGYVDYHLVVRDFCNEARLLGKIPKLELDEVKFENLEEYIKKKGYKYGLGVGPGRGSAAGSLVCYLLGITNIDPIKYNLLFERFLNPERVSMPDIDTDIPTSLRPTIIRYLKWKYGEKAVCSIATELTYGAKAAIKMVGRDRASQLYYSDDDKRKYMHNFVYPLSDALPEAAGVKLKDYEEDVSPLLNANKENRLLWEKAKLIESKIMSSSIHAGGVIISDNDNVNEYVPLAFDEEKEVWAAQCNMIKAEEKGLLKMDLLGLGTLDCISDCVELVTKYTGKAIDIDNIPFEEEVFSEIFAKGDTNSVFQFSSEGMKSMLKEFKPTCFEDIILLAAAYRPGPMQYLEDIIKIKNGEKKVSYKTPELEKILSSTYGAVIYQEQVMQIFQSLAGYSLGGADLVRRAMSKKKLDKLAKERVAFINGDKERNIKGCVANGISEDIANSLFDEMMEFAKYAFNKSHAAAYAYVSYQTAYLKYHYKAEYLCAMFNNKVQKDYAPIISDCELYGIKILPVDINNSYYNFVVEGNNIRYGFRGINGFGGKTEKICNDIVKARQENGFFKDFKDFLIKTIAKEDNSYKVLPGKIIKILCEVGAFDSLDYNRKVLENIPEYKKGAKESLISKINSLEISKGGKDETYNMEKEIENLGMVLSVNPLKNYGDAALYGCTEFDKLQDDTPAGVFGYISVVEDKVSKRGNAMRILTLNSKSGLTIKIILMGSLFRIKKEDLLYKVYRFTGTFNNGTIFARSFKRLYPYSEDLYITITDEVTYQKILSEYEKEDTGRKIHVLSYLKNTENGIIKKDKPLYQQIYLSENAVDKLKILGVNFRKVI